MADEKEIVECEVIDPIDSCDVITDIVFFNKKEVSLKDLNYMCRYISEYEGCENCPINSGRVCGYAVLLKRFKNSENINKCILNWLMENPPTSYLMDIKVKMPNVNLDEKFHIPNFCVKDIYGKEACNCEVDKFEKDSMECRKCWRMPMDPITREEYCKK